MDRGVNVEKNEENIGRSIEIIGEIGEIAVPKGSNTDLNAGNSTEFGSSIINADCDTTMMAGTGLSVTMIVLANFTQSDTTIGMVNTGALLNAN